MEEKAVAIFIEVRMSDGTVLRSDDAEHATKIWDWIQGCEVMASIHGSQFAGKPLTASKD